MTQQNQINISKSRYLAQINGIPKNKEQRTQKTESCPQNVIKSPFQTQTHPQIDIKCDCKKGRKFMEIFERVRKINQHNDLLHTLKIF